MPWLQIIFDIVTLAALLCMYVFAFFSWRRSRRIEEMLAPKTGIEGYLLLAADVFEESPDGMLVCGDDGVIQIVNRELERIVGYDRSELVGQMVELLVPDMSKGDHKRLRTGYQANPSVREMRGLRIRHKNGTEREVAIKLNRYSRRGGGKTVATVRPKVEPPT